ncbi:MAG: CPBP family intramembrane metalloprotease [Opitutae bacterium]|nr:CPBP family intramembrane metalloprotease [Opitutae bacterium]
MSVLFFAVYEEWSLGAQFVLLANLVLAVAGILLLLRKKSNLSEKSSFKVRLWEVDHIEVIALVGSLLIGVFGPLPLGFLPVLAMFAIYWISRKENYPNLVGTFRMGWVKVMSDALIRLLRAWPALLAISFISSQVLSGYPKQESVQKLAEMQSLTEVFNIACYALVVAPVLEEFLFRGILFRAMKRSFGVGPALVISSILFGLVHQNVLSFVPLTFLGIILSLSYERTGDLRTCIFIHAFFNGFMVFSILVGHGF